MRALILVLPLTFACAFQITFSPPALTVAVGDAYILDCTEYNEEGECVESSHEVRGGFISNTFSSFLSHLVDVVGAILPGGEPNHTIVVESPE